MNRRLVGLRASWIVLMTLLLTACVMAVAPQTARAAGLNVTVDAGGPYKTLAEAITAVNATGDSNEMNTITLMEGVSYSGLLPNKPTTIKGATGTETLTITGDLSAMAAITFDDLIVIQDSAFLALFGNGYAVTIGEGIKPTRVDNNCLHSIYGGRETGSVSSTNVTVKGGRFVNVYGGGDNGSVQGNTSVKILQNAQIERAFGGSFGTKASVGGDTWVFISDGAQVGIAVFGGGYGGSVRGNTSVMISAGAKVVSSAYSGGTTVFGGGETAGANVGGSTSVTVTGNGTLASAVYGGGHFGDVAGATSVLITARAAVVSTHGGGCFGTVARGTSVEISGGSKVNNSVLGGGNADSATVNGGTKVTITGAGTLMYGVFGGGNSGTVTGGTSVEISDGAAVHGGVFGAGNSSTVRGTTQVTVKNGHGDPSLGNIFNEGTTTFDLSNDYTYHGILSEGGSVIKTGVGALTLSMLLSNEYIIESGKTLTIEEGSLIIVDTLTNLGTLTTTKKGTLINNGTFNNSGTVANGGLIMTFEPNTGTYVGTRPLKTLKFDTNDGVGQSFVCAEPSASFDFGKLTSAFLPTKQGYKLLGWSKDASGGSPITATPYLFASGSTVYAQWASGTLGAARITLAAPVKGGAATQASVAGDAAYTCTATEWRVADTGAVLAVGQRFETDTEYTATVTLSARPDYKFDKANGLSTMLSGGGTVDRATVSGENDETLTLVITFTRTTPSLVNPVTLTLKPGQKSQLTASEAGASWATSDAEVATVDGNGLVTAVAEGEATITANMGGRTATCIVTVEAESPEDFDIGIEVLALAKGKVLLLPILKNYSGHWSTGDAGIAKITGNGKRVKALELGRTTLTFTVDGVVSRKAALVLDDRKLKAGESYVIEFNVRKTGDLPKSVTLDAKKLTLNLIDNTKARLSATVKPEKALDKQVFFLSRNPAVATVDQRGLVTAVGPGTTKIVAVSANLKRASISVTVTGAVTKVIVSYKKAKLSVGDVLELTASVNDDAVDKAIAWKSSKPGVATVDEYGSVTALKKGKATITATSNNGKKAKCVITVTK